MEQLVYVRQETNECKIFCLEKRQGRYYLRLPVMKGFLGRAGITDKKQEGDMKTPVGMYPILCAFGFGKKNPTKLDYFRITTKTRWCCDENSPYYNSLTNKRWLKSCEDMWKYRKEYRLGFVLGYNRLRERGKGSAIFLHCKTTVTAGCVGVNGADMWALARWLNKGTYIYIENNIDKFDKNH